MRSGARAREGALGCGARARGMFDAYESEYLSSTSTVGRNIERIRALLPGAERDALYRETHEGMDSAAEIVKQMELEAQMAEGNRRAQLRAQAKDYKAGIAALRKRLDDVRSSARSQEQARADLLSCVSDQALRMESEAQHTRLLSTTARMQKGSETLRAACETALETEQIGESIMIDLESQRQTLDRSRATLHFANQGLVRSKRLIQGMGRRALKNRMMMVCIIAMLVIMILFILFEGLFGGSGGDDGGSDKSARRL